MKVIRSIEVKVKYREVDERIPDDFEDKEQIVLWDSSGALAFTEGNVLSIALHHVTKGKSALLCYIGPMFL
jgi:hypothetical protein